jgi:peptide methionine sulfoxide reductase msrA/msrB
MKQFIVSLFYVYLLSITLHATSFTKWQNKIELLTPMEKEILIHKGTERPYSGKFIYHKEHGTYSCKVCNTPLYHSGDKFNSKCGWPSFDDAIKGAIKEQPDKDGKRIEIVCANCGAHMGHIFRGEGFTAKNTRHCVNSLSLTFQPTPSKINSPTLHKAYFAGGCFWGVEYYLEQLKGVTSVSSGYMGGHVKNPTYKQVLYTNTGHLEAVEVIYNPNIINYETLAKHFFEIHDPTQTNGQGPDIGSQYLSAIFVSNETERKTAQKLIALLEKKGLKVATQIKETTPFYKAESYHQNYYQRKGGTPYCHTPIKRFDTP